MRQSGDHVGHLSHGFVMPVGPVPLPENRRDPDLRRRCAADRPAASQDAEQRRKWNAPSAPFRIVGNVYYVGTAGLSSFLIADRAGLLLIDGGLPENAPLIEANVRPLGFQPRNIRYIPNNHSHFDHAGGLAALQRASGGQIIASRGDRADLVAGSTIDRPELRRFPAARPARMVAAGDTARVGRIALTTALTPGHTYGATSWSLRTVEGTHPLDVLFQSSLSVAGRQLTRG